MKQPVPVRYSGRAVNDLTAIGEYLRSRNPRAAEAVGQRIRRSIEQLASFPRLGQRTGNIDILRMAVPRTPYIVFYEVVGAGEVIIHHIRHGARKPIDPGELAGD